jgi:hypothetical protein
MTTTTQTVKSKPKIEDVANGTVVKIIDANGLYWGHFEACENWCGERFWLKWYQ